MIRRFRRSDEGAALAIVLAFVALFGLTATALLGWLTTSFTHARTVSDLSTRVYSSEAGADHAVATLRSDGDLGVVDSACNPDAEPERTYTRTINGMTTTVAIEGQPGSGECLVDSSPLNTPQHAVLALGLGGIDFRSNGGEIQIEGPVHSNGRLRSGNQPVTITAADLEHPSSATAVLGPSSDCNDIVATIKLCGGAPPALDPRLVPVTGSVWNLPSDLDPATAGNQGPGAIPARGTNPVACPSGTAATIRCFLPGRYAAPPETTDTSVLYWFQPGYYYFASGEWTIPKDVAVVAGKLSAGAATPAAIPGACTIAGTEPEWQRGAQMIFGGTARVEINHSDSKLEVCAMPWSDRMRIGIYGVHTAPPSGYSHNTSTILATGPSGKGVLHVEGTIYAPSATIDVNLKNGGGMQLARGIVANTITIKEVLPAVLDTPIASSGTSLPLTPEDRRVLVVSTTGDQVTRAVVTINAVTGAVTIESWWTGGPETR